MQISLASLSYTLSSKTKQLIISTKSIVEYFMQKYPNIHYTPYKQDKVMISRYLFYTASDLPKYISLYIPTKDVVILPPLPFTSKKQIVTKQIVIPLFDVADKKNNNQYIVTTSTIPSASTYLEVKYKIPFTIPLEWLTYKYTAPTRIAIRMHSLHIALQRLIRQHKLPYYTTVFNPNKKAILFANTDDTATSHCSPYDTSFSKKVCHPYIAVGLPYNATTINAIRYIDGIIVLEDTQA